MQYAYFPTVQSWTTVGSYLFSNPDSYLMTHKYIPTALNFFGLEHIHMNQINYVCNVATHSHFSDPDSCSSTYIFYGQASTALISLRFSALLFYPSLQEKYSPSEFVHKFTGLIDSDLEQNICLKGDFSFPYLYVLMITDEANFLGTLTFLSPLRKVSRILKTFKASIFPDYNYGKLTIPPFEVIEDGAYTFHFLALIADYDFWNLAGYQSDYFEIHPTSVPTDIGAGSFKYSLTLPQTKESYRTVVASRFYSHDQSATISCRVQVKFSGLIRALYVNNDIILAGSSLNSSLEVTIESSRRTSFEANEYAYLVIIGANLIVSSVDFIDCLADSTGTEVYPAFQPYYVPSTGNISSFSQYYPKTSSYTCDPKCISCVDDLHCLECHPGYYLHNGLCIETCTNPNQLIPAREKYCDDKPASAALRNSVTYNSAAKMITINYNIQPFDFISYVVTIFFPYSTQYGNHPRIIANSSSFPTLAEASYILTPVANISESFNLSAQGPILETAEINNNIKIISYCAMNGQILYLEINPSNPQIAITKKYISNLTEIALDSSKRIIIEFLLECQDTCRLYLDLKGNLEIVMNERTTIFSAKYLNQKPYQIYRDFKGLHFFRMTLAGASFFNFGFTGSYQIYSLKNFLFEDEIQVDTYSSCSINNCQNCQNSQKCLSCNPGRYLSFISDSCDPSCTYAETQRAEERRCLCRDNFDCMYSNASYCDASTGQCIPCQTDDDCSHLFPIQIQTKCDTGKCIKCNDYCQNCDSSAVCTECIPDFYINGNQCFKTCSPGEGNLDQLNCGEICGDGKKPTNYLGNNYCDDGNNVDGDGCSANCQFEEGYLCRGGDPENVDKCFVIPKVSISQDLDSPNLIILYFTKPMNVTAEDLERLTLIKLTISSPALYSYEIKQKDNQTFHIVFEPTQTLRSQEFSLTFISPQEIRDHEDVPLTTQYHQIRIKEMLYSNKEDEELATSAQTLAQGITTVGIATSGMLLLTGGGSVFLWAFIAILQKYFYLVLLNIDLPENLDIFLRAFTIANLNFIPSFPTFFAPDLSSESVPAPPKFQENDIDGLFLMNSGSILTGWAIILVGLIFAKIVLILGKRCFAFLAARAENYIKSMIWSGIIRYAMGMYFELAMFSLLQIINLTFNTLIKGLSSTMSLFILILQLAFPMWGYVMMKKFTKLPSKRKEEIRSLFESLKEQHQTCRMYNILLMVRRFLMAGGLVLLHDSPYIQVSYLIMNDLIHFIYLIVYRPFEGKNEQFSIIIDESVYLAIYFCMWKLLSLNKSPPCTKEDKLLIGWIIIGLCMTGLVVNLIFLLVEGFKSLKSLVQAIKGSKPTDQVSRNGSAKLPSKKMHDSWGNRKHKRRVVKRIIAQSVH